MVTLVTGATGLVGNNVVRALIEDGRPVRVLARDTAESRPLAGLEVEVRRGDVRDRDAVVRAMRGAGAVVHAAAHVHIGWQGIDIARAINVEGTRNIAQAARAEGARLIHVSSIDALGVGQRKQPVDEDTPVSGGVLCPYVVTKREAEAVVIDCIEQGLHASIVNPGYVIGPYDWKPSSGRMLLHVAKGWGLFTPSGANSYCDVRDVVRGILKALDCGQSGRRYILAGQVLSYYQAWRVFAEVSGGTPPLIPVGKLVRISAGRVGDLVCAVTGREPDVNSAATAISAQWRNFSSARAQRELGYRPRPLKAAAADAWTWFRQNGYV
jgi:dihydroflavonol-4-reductase